MIELLHIDCMEYMATLPDKAFDLAIVDPPYGIGMDGGEGNAKVGYKFGHNHLPKKHWDKRPPSGEYFAELRRVCAEQIIWGGNYFDLPPTRCVNVWDKGAGFVGRSFAECEIAWSSFDKNARIFKHDPLAGGDLRKKIHPTQKPVKLVGHA